MHDDNQVDEQTYTTEISPHRRDNNNRRERTQATNHSTVINTSLAVDVDVDVPHTQPQVRKPSQDRSEY
jgi:hypothetical protein